MAPEAMARKRQRRQLLVVFDTNVLFTGSASDLVRQEVANLVKESRYPDLEIRWHLPEVVLNERKYQMQKQALELLPAINKIERLLGHNLAITDTTLVEGVEKAVRQREVELGLVILKLDCAKVDWNRLTVDAAYRKPPFKDAEKEKGFRDSLVVESFLQLVDDSPKTPTTCRVVLVSADGLISQAVKARTTGLTNTAVISSLEELRSLINTLVSQVDEAFLESVRRNAKKFFFIPKVESTLFYREHIQAKLEEKFAAELDALPPGATSRMNRTWTIHPPNFVKKTGRRIQWTSRIEIEAEASKTVSQESGIAPVPLPTAAEGNVLANPSTSVGKSNVIVSYSPAFWGLAGSSNYAVASPFTRTITTHKGVDIYEVLWSVDVTPTRDLRRASIDEIRHLEPTWQQVN